MKSRFVRFTSVASMVAMLLIGGGCSQGPRATYANTPATTIGGVTASPELVNQVLTEIVTNTNAEPQYKLSSDEISDLKSKNLVSEADAEALELYLVP